MATKKITLNELKSLVKQIIKEEKMLDEVANTDLELKSVAKQIFSILKKYGLKPTYTTGDWKSTFSSKAPADGYGGRIVVGDNGIMGVAVYDRGIWDTLKKSKQQESFNYLKELDMGPQSYPTPEERKQIEARANQIYKEIVSTLGDKFEVRSDPKPNKYGEYVMQIRLKQPAQQQQTQQQSVSESLKLRNYLK
jgi:hypothetical protein